MKDMSESVKAQIDLVLARKVDTMPEAGKSNKFRASAYYFVQLLLVFMLDFQIKKVYIS